jgi:hypothetical protein
LRLLNEKSLLYPYAGSLGIPVPRKIDMGSADLASISYPVAIKPSTRRWTNAFTLSKAWRADSADELRRKHAQAVAIAKDDGVIVQELIPGDGRAQFSYAALWDGSGPLASLVARRTRQYPVEFGATSTFVEVTENAKVEELAERLLASVNYRGLVEVEFKFDEREGSYKLLDVNTRPWTWLGLGAKAGTDFAVAAWKLAFNEPQERIRATRHCAWVHVLRDLVAAGTLWRAGTITLAGYLSSLNQPMTFAAMRLGDPLPGLMDVPILIPRLISRYRRNREARRVAIGAPLVPDVSGFELRDDLLPAEWDKLATEFADATYEQFGAFRGPVWGEGRTRRLAVFRNGRAVALALATVFRLPILGGGLAYVKFGPLWRRKDKAASPEDAATAVAALKDYFVVRNKLALTILPPADLGFGAMMESILAASGFRKTPIDDPERYVVDAMLSEEQQLSSLSKRWRYNLKQSLKGGLTVTFEDGPEAVETFHALFGEMEARKNYKGEHWAALLTPMKEGRLANAGLQTVLVRAVDGEAVAGAVIGAIGDTAYYLFGATGNRALKLEPGYAMQWSILKWLHDRGIRWYDLGGSAHEPGLRHFKEGLTGKAGRVALIPGEFHLCTNPVSGLLARVIFTLRRVRASLKKQRVKH